MEDFDLDSFKFEKSTAMRRFRRLRSLARLFRFVELFAAMAFLTWLSTRAPLAVRASGDYLRRLSAAVASPIFVFFLGNAIVVALFAKSGCFTRSSGAANAESKIYEELNSNVAAELQASPEKEIVFQDKEIICEEVVKIKALDEDAMKIQNPRVSDSDPTLLRLYRRSESEKIESTNCEENKILRRSATDVFRKVAEVSVSGKSEDLEDGMSSDEFRRTIEEFIAKQVKFLREESHSVVHTTTSPSLENDNIGIP